MPLILDIKISSIVLYRVGSEWKWTDGTEMNQALITKGGSESLWVWDNPDGDGKGMEIINLREINGINDISQSNSYGRSYECKIPCSPGNSFFVSNKGTLWLVKV